MTEKITEAQAVDLLALLRSDASVDTKVSQINLVKSGIKQNNVPDACVAPLFEITRMSTTSQHAALANAGFTTLNHLLTRLSRQEPKHISKEATKTLPLIIEKAGDVKDKYRLMASQCLTTIWKAAPMEAERVVKNIGLAGKNSRTKETSLQWLVQMHEENGLQFRAFVPVLMELLEDADGMVRDSTRNAVVALFRTAPDAAKSDLKKQLKNFNVRQTIVSAIVAQLGPPKHPAEQDSFSAAPSLSTSRGHLAESSSSLKSVPRPATPTFEHKVEGIDPAYVNTQRELDDTFKEMHPFFDGKESEQNWLKREQSCTKIRKLNAGNAPNDFREAWLAGIKAILDGILKAINSLRTSLSKEGCTTVQELAITIGPGLDPMVEILLQNLIKLCGGTKKIASQAGDTTVDIIIAKVTYNIRILQHIWFACQDKNVQPRTYAAGWLKTLLKKEAHHKSHMEHTGGLEVVEKCVRKALGDPNPGVREKMRGTYWVFAHIWPVRAEATMATLDATQQKLLENDPGNPNSPKKAGSAPPRAVPGFSKSTSAPPKPSLRDTMLAQKKAAMAAKNLPPRPESAMSSFSPVKTSASTATSSTSASSSRQEASTVVSHGGLSVAPMRPTKFRAKPEIARPATAGPYSVRRPPHGMTEAPSTSTTTATPSRHKARTPSATLTTTSPKRALPARPTTSHSNHTSVSSQSSPSREKLTAKKMPSPSHSSPVMKSSISRHSASPSKDDEDFTMVLPKVNLAAKLQHASPPHEETSNSNNSVEQTPAAKLLKVYEDPFSGNDNTTPRPEFTAPVLEELPVNEDGLNLSRNDHDSADPSKTATPSPERSRQNSKLLDSGLTRIKSMTLDVHGFRKLQGLIRENKTTFGDARFGALLGGLFDYLEAPLTSLAPEKVQDVKAQILTTIKLMLKKDRDAFEPHVSRGLQSLLITRSCYDARTHIVSGLELLAEDLVAHADPEQTTEAITALLQKEEMSIEGCRTLSMGLHILKKLLDTSPAFVPDDDESKALAELANRCISSIESGVRMDAVQLCVAMHARVGEQKFWAVMDGVKEDPKSLITYYIVKRQRESSTAA